MHTNNLTWDVLSTPNFYRHEGKEVPTGTLTFINSETGAPICSRLTDQYQILTNARFSEIAQIIADEKGLQLSHFTTYNGGKKVLAAFKSKNDLEIAGFPLQSNLVLINSHDGTGCFTIGSANRLHRCDNMFASVNDAFSFRHSFSMHDQIDQLMFEIIGVEKSLEEELQTISAFKNVTIDQSIIDQLKGQLFGEDWNGGMQFTTQMRNKMLRFDESLAIETGQLGMNAFGLFNAATHYTTHNFTHNAKVDFRDYPIFGKKAGINKTAFELCAAL